MRVEGHRDCAKVGLNQDMFPKSFLILGILVFMMGFPSMTWESQTVNDSSTEAAHDSTSGGAPSLTLAPPENHVPLHHHNKKTEI